MKTVEEKKIFEKLHINTIRASCILSKYVHIATLTPLDDFEIVFWLLPS